MARSRSRQPAKPSATGANASASLHLSTDSRRSRVSQAGDPEIAAGGVIVRLGPTDELELALPSGQTTSVPLTQRGIERIFRILTAQKAALRPLAEARTGEPEVPTIAFQEHLEKHVLTLVPHSAPGCAFCIRRDRELHSLDPATRKAAGTALRYTSKGLVVPPALDLADLGLED